MRSAAYIPTGAPSPRAIESTYIGYSIGKWIDQDGSGRFDVLEVETRGFKGPRTIDGSSPPLHNDGQSIVKERFYLEKDNPDMLHDEITVIDQALTQPWTATKNYRRDPKAQPVWLEFICADANPRRDRQGALFPRRRRPVDAATKGQAPPDLRHFKQSQPLRPGVVAKICATPRVEASAQ
jgi:hypothetical protein